MPDDEIVEVKGVPLLIEGGDRDVTVRISELEYCITAIALGKEQRARLFLETIVNRNPPSDV